MSRWSKSRTWLTYMNYRVRLTSNWKISHFLPFLSGWRTRVKYKIKQLKIIHIKCYYFSVYHNFFQQNPSPPNGCCPLLSPLPPSLSATTSTWGSAQTTTTTTTTAIATLLGLVHLIYYCSFPSKVYNFNEILKQTQIPRNRERFPKFAGFYLPSLYHFIIYQLDISALCVK